MGFEERVRGAAEQARLAGNSADRPDIEATARARSQRRLVRSTAMGVILLVAGLAFLGQERQPLIPAAPSTTAAPDPSISDFVCEVTIPTGNFMPPGDFTPQPPDIYGSLWHGSAGLWTMVPVEGAVWDALPENTPGLFTQKVFWWAEDYDAINDPATLQLTATETQSGEVFLFEGSAITSGFRPDIGDFMIAGVELPSGCWQLDGAAQGTTTSFVVEIRP